MTCTVTDCAEPRVVLPDPISFGKSTFTVGGAPSNILRLDENPKGESATPWCETHFPQWLRDNRRAPRGQAAKPHIRMTALQYRQMMARMREVNTSVNRIGDAARSGAVAMERFTEAARPRGYNADTVIYDEVQQFGGESA